jgi:hypothetical protein
MTGKVFISYRRGDSAGHAGRVHDRLQLEFGRDLLFMDVDAVPLGVNFIKILREGVAECDALLAVIGPNWLDLPDKEGNRRLDDPHDYVRIEIAAALQRDIPVIPVLLDGAEMPRVDQLPKDIAELALRNGLYVRHASFHSDVDRLIEGLKGPLGQLDAPPAPIARRSPTKKRARTGAAERKVAAEAKPEQETPKITPWLRPITIAIGSAIVLAVGIFGFVIVTKSIFAAITTAAARSQDTGATNRPTARCASSGLAADLAATVSGNSTRTTSSGSSRVGTTHIAARRQLQGLRWVSRDGGGAGGRLHDGFAGERAGAVR